nr:hypothetical protein SYMBAF_50235 [Serratia symbiotica]
MVERRGYWRAVVVIAAKNARLRPREVYLNIVQDIRIRLTNKSLTHVFHQGLNR